MRHTTRLAATVTIAIGGCALLTLQSFAVDPPKAMQRIQPSDVRSARDADYLHGSRRNQLGRNVDSGALIARSVWGVVHLAYPQEREVVPLFGLLYRAARPWGSEFIWIKDEDVPEGMAIRPDSFVIPLIRDGVGSAMFGYSGFDRKIVSITVFVASIRGADPEDGKGPIAEIREKRTDSAERRMVRRGDILKFGVDELEVRNIVQRERGAIGWVELGRKRPKQRLAEIIRGEGTLRLQAVGDDSKKGGAADTARGDRKPAEPDGDVEQAWIGELAERGDSKWLQAIWTTAPRALDPRPAKLDYPPLFVGDTVPLFGRLYVVIEITADSITFKDLPRDEWPKEHQPGLVLVPVKLSQRAAIIDPDPRLPDDRYVHIYLGKMADRASLIFETPFEGPSRFPWPDIGEKLFNNMTMRASIGHPKGGGIAWIELEPPKK